MSQVPPVYHFQCYSDWILGYWRSNSPWSTYGIVTIEGYRGILVSSKMAPVLPLRCRTITSPEPRELSVALLKLTHQVCIQILLCDFKHLKLTKVLRKRKNQNKRYVWIFHTRFCMWSILHGNLEDRVLDCSLYRKITILHRGYSRVYGTAFKWHALEVIQ